MDRWHNRSPVASIHARAASAATTLVHASAAGSRLRARSATALPAALRITLLALPLWVVAFIVLLSLIAVWGPNDSIVYLAGDQRLNAGHPLYALSPGDMPIGLNPPYWTVPLLTPPLIAVIWRPLALLDPVLVETVWWVAMAVVTASSVALLYRRAFIATGLAMLPLAIPVAVLAMSGNIDALRLAGSLAILWLVQRDRDGLAGGVAGFLVVLKLTPLPLVWWLLLIGRPRALVAAMGVAVACLAIAPAGAGVDAHAPISA